ncbi:MAG: aldehyde:ferredoxin oxidoreductase [Deltaproteobacteria bacterium]|nr:aldehyde:ferredoxin oxidoreductase [Deltaproteobacteria bacterium]MBW2691899.1 aldehyde:ferredoxin oxidoreductase [Deltaproteobacteria bacterium]
MAERKVSELSFNRYWVDLEAHSVRSETVACEDLEDLLGGIGRGFKLLEGLRTDDPHSPSAALVMNLGALSGTSMMTGLRTFFHAYSPLKRSSSGLPSAIWSAGSGKFGTKLRFLGVDEVIFTGRCAGPSTLHITQSQAGGEAEFSFKDAAALVGQTTNAKIQALYGEYPDAHFAVVGPAGENYETVLYATIALSSENQLKSGDAKARYCGRGGMGGVMGSKNLLAIVADTPDQKLQPPAATLKRINSVVGTGDGSRRFREAKTGGMGGTWANAEALSPSHAVPEYNFMPTGTDISVPLHRKNVEQLEDFTIKAEACFRCGIRCHKNLYETKSGTFRAKLDYEPLVLLSSNIGVFDVDAICELVELTDQLGLDAISCGVTLSYAMEYNRRHADSGASIAGGLAYGDAAAARHAIESIGEGKLPQLGQGALRLSEEVGEPAYAMHSKGMEFPAYLPQTNPGYPWALAGGHMSMRTYLVLLNEREVGIDYWVDTITSPERGLSIMRDDLVGICKFSGLSNDDVSEAVTKATGVNVSGEDLRDAVLRAFLRGYRLERLQGFTNDDYQLPADVLEKSDAIDLPYFNTPEFFAELQEKVLAKFDALLEANLPKLP